MIVRTISVLVKDVDVTGSAELIYRASDPYCVILQIERSPEWSFARELLTEGVNCPAGIGDVVVRPGEAGVTELFLSSPSGTAIIEILTEDITAFIASTLALVRLGQEIEHLDLDRELEELFS